MMNKDWKQNK